MSLHENPADGTRDHLTGFAPFVVPPVFCFDCDWGRTTTTADDFLAAKEHQHTHRTTNPDPRKVIRP